MPSSPVCLSTTWLRIVELPVSKYAEKLIVSFPHPISYEKFKNLFPIMIMISNMNVLEMQHDGELKYNKDMALYIKHEVEKKFQGSWHIIVGKTLGKVL